MAVVSEQKEKWLGQSSRWFVAALIGVSISLLFTGGVLAKDSDSDDDDDMMEYATARPEDLQKIFPDLSCHGNSDPDAVKSKMKTCLKPPKNKPHYSVCHRLCTLQHLGVMIINQKNMSMHYNSAKAKDAMLKLLNEPDKVPQLITKAYDACGQLYLDYTIERRQSSDEDVGKIPRPCKEWGPFVECIEKAWAC